MRYKRALARDDTGAAMVEFAIVFPILILLVIGIVNFGYLMGQKNEVNNAARQGARAAVVQNSTGSTAQAKATTAVNNTVGHLVPSATTTISGTTCGAGTSVGKEIHVKVTYTNPGFLVKVPLFPISAPAKLESEAVFSCEW